MEKVKIHITVCPDKDYIMPTGVMMYSVCVNNPDVDIDFHVLIDKSVTEEGQQDLKETINMFQGKRALFYSTNSLSTIDFPLNHERLPRSSYYRLFLSDILPSTIEKVLYLDGDVIVRHSLLSLWNTNLTDNAVGATIDVCEGDIEKYNRLRYPSEKGHFNAGVLLINLKYWRENLVEKDFMRYLCDYPDRIIFADQDVLNVIFQDKKLILPVKYNLQTAFLRKIPRWDYWKYESEVKEAIADPTIVHFTEKGKPWIVTTHNPHPFRSTFYKYQNQTKWNNCRIERRSKIQILRNYVGDFLRKKSLKVPVKSNYLDISPID